MARTVYPSREIAHLWANRHNVAIRNSNGTMSAASGRIYSYGHHYVIAAFMDSPKIGDPMILWNDSSYSNTTAKHSSHVWYAMTQSQRDIICHVPGMNEGSLRDLPALAKECIRAAIPSLEKSRKARTNRGMYLSNAERMFSSARRIYLYIGDAKAASAVPTVSTDADKAAIETVLVAINRADYISKANRYRADAMRILSDAEGRADAHRSGNISQGTMAYAIVERCIEARECAISSVDMYKRAAVNVPPIARQLITRAEKIKEEFGPAALEERLERERESIEYSRRDVVQIMARIKHYRRGNNRSLARVLSRGNRLPYGTVKQLGYAMNNQVAGPFNSAIKHGSQYWPNAKVREQKIGELSAIDSRAKRIMAGNDLKDAIETLSIDCDTAIQRIGTNSYTVPSSTNARNALRAWASISKVPQFWLDKANLIIARADDIRADINRRKVIEHAERIESWRNGNRVYLNSSEIPTMIRIIGDTVETSRGATVPLAHAARLVRIAERIAASGGASWRNNDGPMVGHYRVNMIGPDMSAIIGCHEISAEESIRAIPLIKAASPTSANDVSELEN